MTLLPLVIAGASAFVLMEGVTYLAHRFVMHGIGWALHRSHHRRLASRFEANDLFPVVFGGFTVLVMAVAFQLGWPALVAVTVGVTLYGAAYAFVHDVYIHGRLGRLPALPVLERLKQAHEVHHRTGREPYGMLCPVMPRASRSRVAAPPART